MPWGNIGRADSLADPHLYSILEPEDFAAWIDVLAAEYVRLRTEFARPLPDILDLPGLGAFKADGIKARLAKFTVPKPDLSRGNFSVLRADLSEVAAYLALERFFGTEISYKLIRDRELIQLPGRGIDAIGIEAGAKRAIILAEVKFSEQACKPGNAPTVVDTSSDCMRKQHIGHITERLQTVGKLLDVSRKALTDAERDNLMAAALYLEAEQWDQVDVVSCCVLVRPKDCHTPADFGTFQASPLDYKPARVRFLVWKLPGDMESILDAWIAAVESKVQGQ